MSQDQDSPERRYAGTEPTVEELMADPIVRLVLESDRIQTADMWAALVAARRQVALRRWRSAPLAPDRGAA